MGASEWLRITPMSEWPATYMGLRQIGLGAWLVDWLELSMATLGGTAQPESMVVEAFLYLMSRRDTHDSLANSEGLPGAFKSTAQRLRGMFANEPIEQPASIDVPLIEAMASVLSGMTAGYWPDRVFALGDSADEVLDVREPRCCLVVPFSRHLDRISKEIHNFGKGGSDHGPFHDAARPD